MSAILFGSISTIADTSELQRQSFNEAFAAHGLDWHWERTEYIELLRGSGGAKRVAEYAAARGETVDAAAVHATKSEIFQTRLSETELTPRSGVSETVAAAKSQGMKVALVTTTAPENVQALARALRSSLPFSSFDLIVDVTNVQTPKPDKAAYSFALHQLAETAGDCVAIEDNEGGISSAVAAGLACIAFPNSNTASHDLGAASRIVDHIDLAVSRELITAVAS